MAAESGFAHSNMIMIRNRSVITLILVVCKLILIGRNWVSYEELSSYKQKREFLAKERATFGLQPRDKAAVLEVNKE